MKFFMVFCLIFLVAVVADAVVFEWVDSEGVTHFTDKPEKVPVNYWEKVKKRESVQTERVILAPPIYTKQLPKVKRKVKEEQQLHDGHDEWWWRARFTGIRHELDAVNRMLVVKREQLSILRRKRVIFKKARDRVAYNKLYVDIKKNEERAKDLEGRFAALEAEADWARVPQDWHR